MRTPTDSELAWALAMRLADQLGLDSDARETVIINLSDVLFQRRDVCEKLWKQGVIEEDYFDEL